MTKKGKLLVAFLLHLSHLSFSQKADSTKSISHFSGSVSVTNNGISIVPSFSLGKPAAAFNFYFGKNRFSIEPDFRFSLAGKPWGFLFWFRYNLLNKDKLSIRVGAHPALNFREETVALNSVAKKVLVTRRYLATELAPNYAIGKKISVGMYYLFSKGIDEGTIGTTHFITFNSNFSNIKLSDEFFMRVTPQFYYLKLDAQDGFYFTSAVTLAKKNFPLSLSAVINKTINTHITGSKNFLWNVSLNYSFSKNYVRK